MIDVEREMSRLRSFQRATADYAFVRLFGERLLSLPPDTRQDVGDARRLVQPYPLPTQAMTPEGDAAEQRLITVLGPDCFYDHSTHRKPKGLPALPPPPTWCLLSPTPNGYGHPATNI